MDAARSSVSARDRECVLVVDDDPLLLDIVAEQLDSLGVETVRTCEHAEEALALLRQGLRVHTLITDLAMPDVDGPRFLHALADLPGGFTGRILLISGTRPDILLSIEQLGQALGLRMGGTLRKPVGLEELGHLLSQQAHAVRAPARTSSAPNLIEPDRLHAALQAREILPWYQPKFDCAGLRVVGVEALARWPQPQGQMISPARFVPVIESQGWSWELFVLMLDQVLADLRGWLDRGWPLKAAVNLSMDCTHRLDLPEQIARRAADAGVPLDRLLLEVTESGLMADRRASLETLTRLSLMGVGLSIDDFGTGYSSIAQLGDVPFTELKIDGSFVQRLGRDSKADRILQSTVGLGHGLGMTVVAEGVEQYAQLRGLRLMGASVVQGYLLARPMSAAALATWLAQWRPGLAERAAQPPAGEPVSPLVLLLIDPDAEASAHTAALLRALRADLVCCEAHEEAELMRLLQDEAPHAVLLQGRAAGPAGLPLLRQLREACPSGSLAVVSEAAPGSGVPDNLDLTCLPAPVRPADLQRWLGALSHSPN
jgi:EAL domain-containing protein (putative c-di-GMP-specific phosphodiesterase class I)/DNA-binding NarL/FixJ family response regulator